MKPNGEFIPHLEVTSKEMQICFRFCSVGTQCCSCFEDYILQTKNELILLYLSFWKPDRALQAKVSSLFKALNFLLPNLDFVLFLYKLVMKNH